MRAVGLLTGVCACAGLVGPAWAQHASDNPIVVADDAFGLTLGLESIGTYGPSNVRGFNPQIAGNVRLDGLFFDQQGILSERVVEGSRIRVGVSEIGTPFPAPTGIVDYDLRHTGATDAKGSVVVSAGPFEARGFSADAVLPINDSKIQLPIGVAYQLSTQTIYATNPGYTSHVFNVGATPEWNISSDWRVRAIIDWTNTTGAKTLPFIFTSGDFEPPHISHAYFGQDWAKGKSTSENFGVTLHGQLTEKWSLAVGLFHSIFDSPVSFQDLYVDTNRAGTADHHLLIGYPDQYIGSTSGEARLTGLFETSKWLHSLILVVRGRNTTTLYGGADTIDAGEAVIGQGIQVPKPNFQFSPRSTDHTRLLSVGVAWRAQWQKRGDFAVGIQKEYYRKDVTTPGAAPSRGTENPVRLYAQASYALTNRLTVYAAGTEGLEDSGSAPIGSANYGAVLPAAKTWQVDAGMRYELTPKIKMIAGLFEIEKPYFNIDSNGIDRQLGVQRTQGLEISLSGSIGRKIDIAAGALLGNFKVLGPDLRANGIGSDAFGQAHVQSVVNAEYALTGSISFDLSYYHYGAAPETLDGLLKHSPQDIVAVGGRYKFNVGKNPTTLRVQLLNATNYYLWNFATTPGFNQFPGPGVMAYLTVDL